MSITLPENYSYVIAAGAFCGVVLTVTGGLAASKREALGVEYPNLYASDITAKTDPKAFEFNCAQRGALNPHESYATALFGLATGGLAFPLVAAGAGAAWGVGALLYYFGYSKGLLFWCFLLVIVSHSTQVSLV
jgi:glutathione S-transferase